MHRAGRHGAGDCDWLQDRRAVDIRDVHAEDVEAILREDQRVRDAAVVGWPLGADLGVHAVLLLDDPSVEGDVVTTANQRLAPHQQIRGSTSWPDPDLPRTHTLKIRKPDILARLDEIERPGSAPIPGAASKVLRENIDADVDPVTAVVASVAGLDVAAVSDLARLSSDLDLDSLRRVELLGVIEEELGVFLDDDALEPDATVADLVALVEAARDTKAGQRAWSWPLSPFV
jgi:long-chain acyl-CoA synthetase